MTHHAHPCLESTCDYWCYLDIIPCEHEFGIVERYSVCGNESESENEEFKGVVVPASLATTRLSTV